MMPVALSRLVSACHGRFVGDAALLEREVTDVCIDSRALAPGALFVCIQGERLDGHHFIESARANGALCVVTSRPLERAPYVLVSDTLDALQDMAVYYRNLFDIPLVGVTGSSGKTSTKDMCAALLAERFCVHKTCGNHNNQTGVPLTIFGLAPEHEIGVIEMGTNQFGEIERLARIVQPDVCLFTNVGVAHIQNFHTREGILQGKTEMLKYKKTNGAVIANGDNDLLSAIPGATFFGMNRNCQVRAINLSNNGLDGVGFTVVTGGEEMRMNVPIPGEHSVYNALSAIATGLRYGLTLEELRSGLLRCAPTEGRMFTRTTGALTIIDDCYNANPFSVMAAVDVLEHVKGRKVFVMGDMRELGPDSADLHELMGNYSLKHGVDLLVCVGDDAEHAFLGALDIDPRRARYFQRQDEMLEALPSLLFKGDTVLVKASRYIELEKTVQRLMEL